MSGDLIDAGLLFVRRKPRREPPVYRALWLDSDVRIGELARALRFSGLVVSTTEGGMNVIHRAPKPKGAA